MNIALISPNKTSFSETFIETQKNGLKGNVFYYYDGFLPRYLDGEGRIQIKFGSLKKRLGLIYHDILSESLLQSFKNHKIDVVLAQYGPTGEAVAPICEKLNIPIIVHFHGYDASIQTVIKKHDYYQDAFRVAKFVIAVSKVMVSDLIALGCPKDKIVYNPCAPNDIFYGIKPKFTKPQFLTIGRFTDKKAPYYTILAFKEVLKEYPKATLVFGGDGLLLNTCENLVKHLDIENNVSFRGVIEQHEFIGLLEESLAFVQHSITADNGDKEGTPVAVMEASLAGLPVISTIHAGIPDVIINERTGLLIKEHDVRGMTKFMIKLLNDLNYAKMLGQNGKEKVWNNYRLTIYLEKLQKALEKSIS